MGRFIKESKLKLQTAIEEQDINAQKDVIEQMKKFRWIWSHMETYKELGNIGYVPVSAFVWDLCFSLNVGAEWANRSMHFKQFSDQ